MITLHTSERSISLAVDCILAGVLPTGFVMITDSSIAAFLMLCADVVKSRIQLRATPPTGTPVQYIARELKAIVAEGGWSVFIAPTVVDILLISNTLPAGSASSADSPPRVRAPIVPIFRVKR